MLIYDPIRWQTYEVLSVRPPWVTWRQLRSQEVSRVRLDFLNQQLRSGAMVEDVSPPTQVDVYEDAAIGFCVGRRNQTKVNGHVRPLRKGKHCG